MSALFLDIALLVFLAIHIVRGIGRGFFLGVIDLLGWVVTLSLTLVLAPSAKGLLEKSLPKGVAGFVVTLVLMFVIMLVYALLSHKLYHVVIARFMRKNFLRADRVLGALTGLGHGLVLAGLCLEFVLLIPWSASLKGTIMDSRLTRPVALAASAVGMPFVALAQSAASDVSDFVTKKIGEPPTRLTLPVTDLSTDTEAERQMLDLLNVERAQRGMPPLVLDVRLTQVARQHSEEMLRQHYFAHDSPTLGSPFDRMAHAGIRYRWAGENIALAPSVEHAHAGLMNSPEHRDNILRPEFRKVGIGIVNGGLSGETFTQDFTD